MPMLSFQFLASTSVCTILIRGKLNDCGESFFGSRIQLMMQYGLSVLLKVRTYDTILGTF